MFSFPPENFLTLLAPGFFGDVTHLRLLGPRLLVGDVPVPERDRACCWRFTARAPTARGGGSPITMALILLLLALGSHTPLFRLLYDCAPGFNRFRGMSKFAVQASAFIALLSGIGLDRLVRAAKVDRRLAAAPILLGAALLIAAAWIGAPANSNRPSPGWWRMMRGVGGRPGDPSSRPTCTTTPPSPAQAQVHAARSLLLAALPCAIAAAGLLFLRSARKLAFVLAIVAAGEMLLFALSIRPTFHLAAEPAAGAEAVLRTRIPAITACSSWTTRTPPCRSRAYGFWGYGPLLPGRFAEFMYASQGRKPDSATSYLPYPFVLRPGLQNAPASLRDRAERRPGAESRRIPGSMPHVALIRQYAVVQRPRRNIPGDVWTLRSTRRRKVILESEPDPEPERPPTSRGRCGSQASGTDFLDHRGRPGQAGDPARHRQLRQGLARASAAGQQPVAVPGDAGELHAPRDSAFRRTPRRSCWSTCRRDSGSGAGSPSFRRRCTWSRSQLQ